MAFWDDWRARIDVSAPDGIVLGDLGAINYKPSDKTGVWGAKYNVQV